METMSPEIVETLKEERLKTFYEDGLNEEEVKLLTTPLKHLVKEENAPYLFKALQAKDRHVKLIVDINKKYEKENPQKKTKGLNKSVYLHGTSSKQVD